MKRCDFTRKFSLVLFLIIICSRIGIAQSLDPASFAKNGIYSSSQSPVYRTLVKSAFFDQLLELEEEEDSGESKDSIFLAEPGFLSFSALQKEIPAEKPLLSQSYGRISRYPKVSRQILHCTFLI